ncbi:MAG: leucyl aminopeptidase family protein, partial [Solirubrobacterales bacterium]
MRVEIADNAPNDAGVDLVCIGLLEGDQLPAPFADAAGAGDVKTGFRKVAVLHPGEPAHVAVIGLGEAADLDRERLRVAGALGTGQARKFEAGSIAWILPEAADPAELAPALVEGTILATYRFDRYRSAGDEDDEKQELALLKILTGAGDAVSSAVEQARVAAEAANRARDLQSLPGNEVTPSYLADRAGELAAQHDSVSAEILGPAEAEGLGMGGLVSVARGSALEPRFIALRYSGGAARSETVALVGKAVTFDSGGISIKPSGRMHEMKMDMSGGAAVLEALAAIAELKLRLDVLAVIPAVENMPSGDALRPGDIITQMNGKTVEIINTDAEGRLILADALSWAVDQGADRIVDLATLTGAVISALGSTYAALVSNDDEWAAAVGSAADETGELAWRLPLHEDFKELTKGTIT